MKSRITRKFVWIFIVKRQANDSENIEKYERSIDRQLREIQEAYEKFSLQQLATFKAYQNVVGKELESYQIQLQDYCNIPEDDLIEMEPFTRPEEDAMLTRLRKRFLLSILNFRFALLSL